MTRCSSATVIRGLERQAGPARELLEQPSQEVQAERLLRHGDLQRPDDAGTVLESPDVPEVELGEKLAKLDLGLARERDYGDSVPSQVDDRRARLGTEDTPVVQEGTVEVREDGGGSHDVLTRAGS